MTRSPRHRLLDIIEAIDNACAIIHGRTPTDIERDWALRQALQMALVIIAEAAKSLPAGLTSAYPMTPWSDIIGMGVRIKHHYYRVDPRIVWDAVTKDFPELRSTIERMLADVDQPALPS